MRAAQPLAALVEAAVDHGRADLLLAQRLLGRRVHRRRAVAVGAAAHRDRAAGAETRRSPAEGTRQAYPGLRLIRARSATDRAARWTGVRPPSAPSSPRSRWRRPPRWSTRWPQIAPVVALGVVYLVAVLLVSSVWGGWLGAATALASALAFNFFHIPPTGRFTISEGENWVALAVFFIAALVASTLAERARVRTREAAGAPPGGRPGRRDGAAAAARREPRRGAAGGRAAPRPRARAAVGGDRAARRRAATSAASRCRWASRPLGTLLVPAGLPSRTSSSACASASCRRSRRSSAPPSSATRCSARWSRRARCAARDELKTALLRAVSHDLRSPLTAILTAAGALDSASLSPTPSAASWWPTSSARPSGSSRLVDNLLDLSRLEARTAEPRVEWCSIEEVIAGRRRRRRAAAPGRSRWRSTPTCR